MAVPRLKEKYLSDIVPAMREEFGYANLMQVPKVVKVTLNMGIGEGTHDAKQMEEAAIQLGQITGQKPEVRRARKSVANFKLRTGMPVGLRVTLRGDRMYEMLDRLMSVALPRIRDFRGVAPSGFDGRGNYNLGIKEQIIFPEIDYDKIDRIRGLDVAITTTAKTDDEGRALLKLMGMPFRES
ncbi:MAG: 50S ribosomal protein L5 [Actinobacteria bacterium]|nr:50S ribosomal protein L5 [Actinomycetota bacterium]